MNEGNLKPRLRERGMTLLELAFVMLLLGILTSTLVPLVSDMHHRAMAEEDQRILGRLKEALIGQFLATGALPACLDGAGNPAPGGNCDTARSLAGFPLRHTDSRNNPIRYDVWNVAGADLTGSTRGTACAVLDAAIAMPYAAGQPAQCAGAPDNQNSATWASYCGTAQNIAFVLVGTGLNRPFQSNEVVAGSASRPGNRNIGTDRIFERPERRPVGILPGTGTPVHYDDRVEVITLQELKARCPL